MPDQKHDKMRVLITAPDERALEKLLRDHPIDAGCTGGISGEGSGVRVEALVPNGALDRLRREKVKVEVLDNASETGRQRQREVGRGNRFEGKTRIPCGLGRKVREERP